MTGFQFHFQWWAVWNMHLFTSLSGFEYSKDPCETKLLMTAPMCQSLFRLEQASVSSHIENCTCVRFQIFECFSHFFISFSPFLLSPLPLVNLYWFYSTFIVKWSLCSSCIKKKYIKKMEKKFYWSEHKPVHLLAFYLVTCVILCMLEQYFQWRFLLFSLFFHL